MAFFLAILSALWLGIWTSITPCPLATNIAAMSFIGKRIDNPRAVLLSGLVYTAGRIIAYVVVGILVVGALLSTAEISDFLQTYMNKILGPLLIVVGMLLLRLIQFPIPGLVAPEKLQATAEKAGLWGAGLLGIVFALSFCPLSASLFFGPLIALSVKHEAGILFPMLYGIGTGLPVVGFAILIAVSAHSLGTAFNKLTQIEWWIRQVTGVVFILVGIYFCLRHIFGVF